MLIYLLRHGLTEYNAQKRYQGQRDIPLSPEGLAQLRRADIDPKVVYISTLQRTRQTAEVLFPDAELVPVDGLKEMCFGSFEGRNYIEMEHDPDYQAWVALYSRPGGGGPPPTARAAAPTVSARTISVTAYAARLRCWWTRRWPTARKCW